MTTEETPEGVFVRAEATDGETVWCRQVVTAAKLYDGHEIFRNMVEESARKSLADVAPAGLPVTVTVVRGPLYSENDD